VLSLGLGAPNLLFLLPDDLGHRRGNLLFDLGDPGRDAVRCVLAGLLNGLVGLVGDPGRDVGVILGLLSEGDGFGLRLARPLGCGLRLTHQAGNRVPTEPGHRLGNGPAGLARFLASLGRGRPDGVRGSRRNAGHVVGCLRSAICNGLDRFGQHPSRVGR
jgi:hypothetical protein